MLSRLLPRTTDFYEFFELHAGLTVRAAILLRGATTRGADVRDAAVQIKQLEHAGDEATRRCLSALHGTFVTPMDRDAMHRLIVALDDVLDSVDDAARRLSLYEVHDPPEQVRELADVLTRATEAVERAVRGMRDLRASRAILDACVAIGALEDEGDTVYGNAVARLFRETRDPIQLLKLREIYEVLENAIDGCEDVANLAEGIVLEHA